MDGTYQKRGSNFTIRKFSEVPISVFELVDFGTLNYQMLAYLSLMIGNGMNVFVSVKPPRENYFTERRDGVYSIPWQSSEYRRYTGTFRYLIKTG
jgi:hypothetical protein